MATPTLILGANNWAIEEDNILGYALGPSSKQYLPREISFTRGSDATYTDSTGVIRQACWNLLQYSEDLTNGVWGKQNTTITANSTNAPDSALTADQMFDDTSLNWHRIIYTTSVISGNAYTYSIYLKANTETAVQLNSYNIYASNSFNYANFDLQNGVVGTYANCTPSITNIGNGWYRCSITQTSVVSGTSYLYITTTNNNPLSSDRPTYAGAGNSFYIWGAQLVQGSDALGYLRTTDRLNMPRVDSSTGTKAFLLEPQRTNLCLQSESFDNASWTKDSSATVTANTTTAPDGNTTADTINLAAVANSRINQVININNSTTYTVSGYFKNIALASGENISLIYGNTNSWGPPNNFTATASIDLFNGTATYSLTGTSGTGFSGSASGSIQNVGNGWYRVSLTFTTGTAAATGGVFRLISSTVASARLFYAWGMQMELGAYPTTYVPTTSTTVTRIGDTFSKSNIYTNRYIGQNGGTWLVELRNNISYVRDNTIGIFIGDTTGSNSGNQFIIRATSSGRLAIFKCISSVPTQIFGTSTDTIKFAIKWNGTSADLFVNGTKEVSATSFTTTAMENLIGGCGSPMLIQQIKLYSEPLSDAECIEITTL